MYAADDVRTLPSSACVQEDMMKAVRKLNEAKKLEGSSSYDQSFGEGK